MRAHTTPVKTTHLFLLEDLADVSRTRELAESHLDALRAVADWIKTFAARPHIVVEAGDERRREHAA